MRVEPLQSINLILVTLQTNSIAHCEDAVECASADNVKRIANRAHYSHARVMGKGLLSASAASVFHAFITPLAAPAASIDPSCENAMRSGVS